MSILLDQKWIVKKIFFSTFSLVNIDLFSTVWVTRRIINYSKICLEWIFSYPKYLCSIVLFRTATFKITDLKEIMFLIFWPPYLVEISCCLWLIKKRLKKHYCPCIARYTFTFNLKSKKCSAPSGPSETSEHVTRGDHFHLELVHHVTAILSQNHDKVQSKRSIDYN